MAQLQERISGHDSGVRLVSFSVDPENDTPLVLAAYAEKAGAEAARWTFVTGPVDEVERAVELGFKVSAAKIAKGAADYDVVHGEWLVLVDRTGDIRGYYPTGEAREFRALTDDLSRLENEKK
jgi:protein SCO1/2